MANKAIKGITIEINGDATRLDKALRSVNTTLNETQSDLRGVERALKLDPSNVILLEQKQKLLAQAAEQAAQKHDTLRNALEQAKNSGTATADQLDALTRETAEAAVQADAARNAYNNFSPALEQTKVKAGEVAEQFRGLSIAGAGVVAAIGGMAVKAASAADEIATLAQQTGFSVEFIQEMEFASERVDVSVDTMTGAMTKLKRNMSSDSGDVAEAFRTIGVNVKALENSGASMDEIFMEVVGALGGVSDELERDQIAMTIFGRSADQLAGILDDGGMALMGYAQEAEDLGLVLDGEAMSGAQAFSDAMDRMAAIAEASVVKAGAALLNDLMPVLEDFMNVAANILGVISAIPAPLQEIMLIIGMVVGVISPIARAISNVSGAIKGVSTISSAFHSLLENETFVKIAKWTALIIGVVVALTLLIEAINKLTGKGESMNETLDNYADATSQIGSVASVSGGGGGYGYGGATATRQLGYASSGKRARIQGYASGGVFEPNTPMLIAVGDNRNEREVLSPRSELVSAYGEAMQRYGGGRPVAVSVKFEGDLAQLGKVLRPTISAATEQRGKVV